MLWPAAGCGAKSRAPTSGVRGRRGGRPGAEAVSPAARELQAPCGCPTNFLAGRTRGPGAPQWFPLAGDLPFAPAGVASPLTPSPPARFHLCLRPFSPAHLTPAQHSRNAPQTAPRSIATLHTALPWPLVPVTSCPGPRSPRCARALAPVRPGPALTPTAALQSQAGSEAAAEPIHGPWSTRRPLPGPRRPRPPVRDLGWQTLSLFLGEEAEGDEPGRGGTPSGLRPNPRRTWAGPLFPGRRAGLRGVTEGARRASGRGGATWLPPSVGRPGKLDFPSPAVRKCSGSPRSHPLPPRQARGVPARWASVHLPGGSGTYPRRRKSFQNQHTFPTSPLHPLQLR